MLVQGSYLIWWGSETENSDWVLLSIRESQLAGCEGNVYCQKIWNSSMALLGEWPFLVQKLSSLPSQITNSKIMQPCLSFLTICLCVVTPSYILGLSYYNYHTQTLMMMVMMTLSGSFWHLVAILDRVSTPIILLHLCHSKKFSQNIQIEEAL